MPTTSRRIRWSNPPRTFDALLGDFWPENESADEFVVALGGWRHDGPWFSSLPRSFYQSGGFSYEIENRAQDHGRGAVSPRHYHLHRGR